MNWCHLLLRCFGETTTQCLCTAPWGGSHDPAPEGYHCSAAILSKGWCGDDCEKTGEHGGSQATTTFEWSPQAHIDEEFGLHPVYWHQWMWREEWFEFLSTTTSSRLCTALHNSSTLNNLPSRSLWPGGSFFTLCHYFSIPTAVILIRRFRNVHIFDQ